jgi:hypothetical protein
VVIYVTQPYTYRELMRYHMDTDIISSRDTNQRNNYFTINVPGKCLLREVLFVYLTQFHRV